mgnify:CR=1 FL=1
MTDTFNKIKEELSLYYPGITDIELTEMTSNLIDFYTTAGKTVLEALKAETPLNDIDDS